MLLKTLLMAANLALRALSNHIYFIVSIFVLLILAYLACHGNALASIALPRFNVLIKQTSKLIHSLEKHSRFKLSQLVQTDPALLQNEIFVTCKATSFNDGALYVASNGIKDLVKAPSSEHKFV